MGLTVNHQIRWKEGSREVELTPMKAIRYKCLDCTNWSTREVKNCRSEDCPLFPYREYGTEGWREDRRQPGVGSEMALSHEITHS